MGSNQFCFKICDPAVAGSKAFCNNIYDMTGCGFVAPAAVRSISFSSILFNSKLTHRLFYLSTKLMSLNPVTLITWTLSVSILEQMAKPPGTRNPQSSPRFHQSGYVFSYKMSSSQQLSGSFLLTPLFLSLHLFFDFFFLIATFRRLHDWNRIIL